jgi:hypothetical protein
MKSPSPKKTVSKKDKVKVKVKSKDKDKSKDKSKDKTKDKTKNNDNNVMTQILDLLQIKPHDKKSNPEARNWMFTGRFVLSLYKDILKDVILQPYEKPEIIDIIMTDKVYNKIIKRDNLLLNNTGVIMPLSNDHMLHIISEKNSHAKLENAESYGEFYIANISDILADIESSLPSIGAKVFEIFTDIDYISKIILFKTAINDDMLDIHAVVHKLQMPF